MEPFITEEEFEHEIQRNFIFLCIHLIYLRKFDIDFNKDDSHWC